MSTGNVVMGNRMGMQERVATWIGCPGEGLQRSPSELGLESQAAVCWVVKEGRTSWYNARRHEKAQHAPGQPVCYGWSLGGMQEGLEVRLVGQGPWRSRPYTHAKEFGHIHVLEPVIKGFQIGKGCCGEFVF